MEKHSLKAANVAVRKSKKDIRTSQQMLLTDNCTSLRSSRLNLASVASELEYGHENADIDDEDPSFDIQIEDV